MEWEWWANRNTRDLFIYCLLMANHEAQIWNGITIERGSFVTTLSELSDGVGLTMQQTRTALSNMRNNMQNNKQNNKQKTNEITCKTTNKFTIITICNYEKYQCGNIVEQQTEQQTNNKKITNEITNKITNEQEKEKKNPPITPYKENKKNDPYEVEREDNAHAHASADMGVVMKVEDLKKEIQQECDTASMGTTSMCRLYGLQLSQVKEAAAVFADKLIADGTTVKSRGDFRRHFNSWLKINHKELFKDGAKTEGPRSIADASQFADRL